MMVGSAGNQGNGRGAVARVYVVGRREAQEDLNVVTGIFLLHNRYASICLIREQTEVLCQLHLALCLVLPQPP